MKDRIYRIMLRSFDTAVSENDAQLMRIALGSFSDLAHNKKFFVELRTAISALTYSSFSPGFAHRVVVAAFSTYNEFTLWLGISFRRVAMAAAILAALCSYYNISGHESVDIASLFGQPEPSFDDVFQIERFLQ